MRNRVFVLASLLAASSAYAMEGDMPAQPQTPSPAETAAPAHPAASAPAASAPHGANAAPEVKKPKTAKPENHDAAQDKQKAAADHKAYARKLAAEIRRHLPQSSQLRGTVTVHFTIGASGRVVSHQIVSASDPSLAPEIEKILASIHVPSPPGGAFSANQEFVFH